MRSEQKKWRSVKLDYTERVNLAIDYIIQRLADGESPGLTDVARAAALSPFHFHRVFQMMVGTTVAEFVRDRRLDHALFLMVHRRKATLTAVALDSGFASSSDFSRGFRRRFGVAPSRFDLRAWCDSNRSRLEELVAQDTHGWGSPAELRIHRPPPRQNADGFRVRIRELPPKTVAYVRVSDPYKPQAVTLAASRLIQWAEKHGYAEGRWFGYQWENPEITPLERCRYHVAVEAEGFLPHGDIGRFRFPAMLVAQVEVRGPIELELRALQWLYGTWLPRSGYVPDDHPCFEAWIGRPFAHGSSHFELHAQLPITR